MKSAFSILLFALAVVVGSQTVAEGDTLFNDLGTGSNVYNWVGNPPLGADGYGSGVGGRTAIGDNGSSATSANLFTVAGTGSLAVTEIDLAVTNANGAPNTFYASIWTDNGGLPGAELPGARWNLSTTNTGTCCSLVSITGITGVDLIGGSQYFMVLGPLDLNDASYNYWNNVSLSETGLVLFSTDGGTAWISNFGVPLDGFDVLSTPEPNSAELLGLGFAGLAALKWRQKIQAPF